uniref:Uncharacterized protein n=1 Tax=Peronospora matthiolae TaxID=2874970 RepID=A0AAV1VP11_9STRA
MTEPGVKDVVEGLVDEKTIEPVEMKMDATTIKLVEVVATSGTAVVAGTSDVAGEPDVVANTEQTEAVA